MVLLKRQTYTKWHANSLSDHLFTPNGTVTKKVLNKSFFAGESFYLSREFIF